MSDFTVKNYQRLFSVENNGVTLLASDVFMSSYKNLNCLSVYFDKTWTTYLPITTLVDTEKEGLKLYADTDKTEEFISGFNLYMSHANAYYQNILAKEELTADDVRDFFLVAAKFHSFYLKTESFFTDRASEKKSENDSIKANLERIESLKGPAREFLNNFFFNEGYLAKLVSKISKSSGIDLENLYFYTMNEISTLKPLAENEIDERKKAFVMLGLEGEIEYMYGRAALVIVNKFLNVKTSKSPEKLSGTIASNGLAKGRVRVIPPNYHHNHKLIEKLSEEMQQGEIIVAETTSPELTVICRKAAGIITNQGGILSHAAIISREMGIPCLVGVQNSTKILKTGDLIQIDANNGLIEIINN